MSKFFVADENRLDKDMEDERNNKVGLSLEMNDQEVIFQKTKKKKKKKYKCNEGDEDSNDKGFDLHEVHMSEILTVTHKLNKKKKRSKVQLPHVHYQGLDKSSRDLLDGADSNGINTFTQTLCEKEVEKKKARKGT